MTKAAADATLIHVRQTGRFLDQAGHYLSANRLFAPSRQLGLASRLPFRMAAYGIVSSVAARLKWGDQRPEEAASVSRLKS
jgi:hypothetical protein